MKVIIASDHAGFALKQGCIGFLESEGHSVKDFGPHSGESVDYPDFAHQVASHVAKDLSVIGVLICGSANGVAMTANKYEDVRACLAWSHEIAELGRLHNNANIL
ncbi:MAG TPA: ribose-5-phosphate isomerase, partial [Bacteroidetes bacterium]|nr:ribose-5-phosphate isomerase [Bacteroidota bacterium]